MVYNCFQGEMDMKRRDKGEGSISQRKDGLWTGRIDIGTQDNGKRKIKAVYGKTEQEVKRKLRDLKKELIKNDYQEVKKQSVKEYMSNWLYNYKQNEVKPSTFDRIEQVCENQIFPYIGDLQINSITANDFQKMINELSLKYSYSTVKKAYDYTKACFTWAHDKRELLYNPFVRVSLPANKKKDISDIHYYNDDEIKLIREYALQKYDNGCYIYKYGYAIILLLYTGLRVGELLALKWDCVDFEQKTLTVKGNVKQVKNRDTNAQGNYKVIEQNTTKTKSGMRLIPLSNFAMEALFYFKEINSNHVYIISASEDKPLSPRNLDRTFRSILSNAGINNIHGVHSLRHTFASMLFRKGVDVKTVSELLGHADTGVTYNIYIHLIQEQKVKAIEGLDEL